MNECRPACTVFGLIGRGFEHEAGFSLIEVTFALALIGLIAALSLPRVLPQSSATVLRSKAFEVAALLRADRNIALRTQRQVATLVDVSIRRVRSGASGASVSIPEFFVLRSSTGRGNMVYFYPNGTSSGGEVMLANANYTLAIRIDDHTAAIDIRGHVTNN